MRKPKNWNEFCPNPQCTYYGQKEQGNISSIATYHAERDCALRNRTESGKRRIFHCNTCNETFSETRDTVFFDLRTPEDKVMMALKMILVRMSLSAITFVLGVTAVPQAEWVG